MPERASIFTGVQIGKETTPGTGVAAGKKLLATSFEVGANPDVQTFTPNGYKFATIATLNREWVEGSIDGQMSYTDVCYLLASLISDDTPATVGTTGKEYVFTSDSDGPDTPLTYTVEQGSSVRAHKFTNGLVTGITLSFDKDGTKVDGTIIGTALQDAITLTAAPTEIDLVPVMRTQIGVKLADTQAGLGAAAYLTRVLSAEWSLTDRFKPVWTLNRSTSWDTFIEAKPKGRVKFMVAADAAGMALLTNMRAGTTKFIRIAAIGPVIGAGPATYELEIDTAIKITDMSDLHDEDGLFVAEWTAEFAHDITWGKSFSVRVVNGLASL